MTNTTHETLRAFASFRGLPPAKGDQAGEHLRELVVELLTDLRAFCATNVCEFRPVMGSSFDQLLTESGERFEERVYGNREALEAEHLREMKRVYGYGPTQQFIESNARSLRPRMDRFILRESIAAMKTMPDHPEPRRIPLPSWGAYRTNSERTYRENALPCVVCGKHIDNGKGKTVHVIDGGVHLLVAEDEKYWDPHDPELSAGDMCFFPIGPDCLRKHPELKPAVVPQKG